MTQPTTARLPIAESWATSGEAPLWVAIALYAVSRADPATGQAHMRAGELREAVAPHAHTSTISHGVRRAIKAGWLHPSSSAWCLRLARPRVT